MELKAIWSTPPLPSPSPETLRSIDIAIIESERFHKYAKNLDIGCIWYMTNLELEARINSMTFDSYDPTSPPPKPPPIITADVSDSDKEVKVAVSKKYHDFLDVFSSDEVKKLEHHPYDINIELEEGKTLPFGPIYSLSQDKCKALFEYIEHNLEKGFIHQSTSSTASPILFIKQKTGDLRLCIDY